MSPGGASLTASPTKKVYPIRLGELIISGVTLTSASGRGDINSARYLLQNGKDVSMNGITGETALTSVIQFAAHSRILEVVELFLSFSAGIHPVQIKICRVPCDFGGSVRVIF